MIGTRIHHAQSRLATAIDAALPQSAVAICHAAVAAATRRTTTLALVKSMVTVALAIGACDRAMAATYTVTSAADDYSAGTLRHTITMHANFAAGSTVQFDPSLNGQTITLLHGQIPVEAEMTIQGPGANQLTISGNNASSVFRVYSTAITAPSVTISGLTLSGGKGSKGGAIYAYNVNLSVGNDIVAGNAAQTGGAIYAHLASVTVSNTTIQTNTASLNGAGIFSSGGSAVHISDSSIDGNTASSCCGGGYFGNVGTVTITNSTLTNNHANNGNGGGLAATYSPLQVSGSTISGNNVAGANHRGGGLWVFNSNASVSNTSIANNHATYHGGGVYFRDGRTTPSATLDVERSTISGNTTSYRGGGICAMRLGSLTIGYSLLSDNHSNFAFSGGGGGGGLSVGLNAGTTHIHDSTVYGNYAAGPGGGIDLIGASTGSNTTLTSVTLVGNSTSATYISNGLNGAGTPIIDSSILANNSNANAGSQDLVGSFTVNFSVVKTKGTATLSGSNNLVGTDPSLGPLAANGGPTQSMLPNSGSPVLDKGDTAIVSGLDQRGFPRVIGTHADIGAVEFGGSLTTLASSPNPSALGQSVTFTATVSGQSPTGTVTFKDGATTICPTVTLSSGSATCPTSSLTAGSHSITAIYNGDSNNAASTSAPLTQVIVNQASSTALMSSVNPSMFGQNVAFTATVTGQSPTGDVTFKDGVTTLCATIALSGVSATCQISSLAVGSHSITATYNGDANNAPSTSSALTQTVNKAASSTALMSSANPSTLGQSVTFTATVTAQSPTGTVTFKDGATTICPTVALSSGSAACPISTLVVGSHLITAVYNGDGNNAASTSSVLTQTVNKAVSITTLMSSANPSAFNQSVTFTATVSGQSPTGNVTFKDGSTTICSAVALSGVNATCPISALAVGSHSITATYNGDSNNAASTSSVLTQTVNKAASSTTLMSSANPSTFNQSVTFTATVTAQSPTGTVTFKDGSTTICATVPLSGVSASCPISTLMVGSHSITAIYNGDGNNAASASSPLMQTVNKATSSTVLGSSINPSAFNQSVTFTATVTGQSPTGTVTFMDGATTICPTVALSAGVAQCSTSSLAVGGHSMTAAYNGDGNNVGSTSSVLTQTVNNTGSTASSTTLSTNCMTIFVAGEPFTMSATVTGASPSGAVTFNDGASVICGNVILSAGAASCSTSSLAVQGGGTQSNHDLTASYGGDINNTGSTSAILAVTVLKASDVVFRNGFETETLSCPIE